MKMYLKWALDGFIQRSLRFSSQPRGGFKSTLLCISEYLMLFCPCTVTWIESIKLHPISIVSGTPLCHRWSFLKRCAFPRGTIAAGATGFWKLWVTAGACGWLALLPLMTAGVVCSDKTVALVIKQQAKHRSSFLKCLLMEGFWTF